MWKSDGLVLTKWFAVQASSTQDDTLEKVVALTKHPDFQITNPNSVYALLRVFGTNLVRFHDPKNPGYSFMADRILEVDAKNPQVASRLAACFQVLAKLPPELREKAKTEIRRVLDEPKLSKNTRELLTPAVQ